MTRKAPPLSTPAPAPSAPLSPETLQATSSRAPSSSPSAKVGYLFGHPIAHSLSPIVHQLVFQHLALPFTYRLHESASLASCLALAASPDCYGAAVTMPHKVSIIPHLDHLTPEGAAVGAVNTIFFARDAAPDPLTGRRPLHGTNTDCIGIREALRQNLPAPALAALRSRPALIVGGGGTARAAVYALTASLGCTPIYMLNRDADEVEAVVRECHARGFGSQLLHIRDVAQAAALPPPTVVVSGIPDFAPATDGERLVRESLGVLLGAEEKGVVLEMCYHPSPDTAITRLALEKGWRVIPGTEAMVWQGLEQDRYWTGRDVKEMPELVAEVKRAVAEGLERSRRLHEHA